MLDFRMDITNYILSLSNQLSSTIGEMQGMRVEGLAINLRKTNLIRTIYGTTKIEGNTLNQDQIETIIDGERVVGPIKEIKEVANTLSLYNSLESFDFWSEEDFLMAHKILMTDLLGAKYTPGEYRSVAVKVGQYFPPPADKVPNMMKELFYYIKSKPNGILIDSIIAHLFIETIHPFVDGNGRMGRFWQTLGLSALHPVFKDLSVENIIASSQDEYYRALYKSQSLKTIAPFVEYMLKTIEKELSQYTPSQYEYQVADERYSKARSHFGLAPFSLGEYHNLNRTISYQTAILDLKKAVQLKILSETGKTRTKRYSFLK